MAHGLLSVRSTESYPKRFFRAFPSSLFLSRSTFALSTFDEQWKIVGLFLVIAPTITIFSSKILLCPLIATIPRESSILCMNYEGDERCFSRTFKRTSLEKALNARVHLSAPCSTRIRRNETALKC